MYFTCMIGFGNDGQSIFIGTSGYWSRRTDRHETDQPPSQDAMSQSRQCGGSGQQPKGEDALVALAQAKLREEKQLAELYAKDVLLTPKQEHVEQLQQRLAALEQQQRESWARRRMAVVAEQKEALITSTAEQLAQASSDEGLG